MAIEVFEEVGENRAIPFRCNATKTRLLLPTSFPVCREIAVGSLICDDGSPSSSLPDHPKTEPDPHERYCAGMKKGQCSWHRGRAVGGTTNINGMFYVRGGLVTSSLGQTVRQRRIASRIAKREKVTLNSIIKSIETKRITSSSSSSFYRHR